MNNINMNNINMSHYGAPLTTWVNTDGQEEEKVQPNAPQVNSVSSVVEESFLGGFKGLAINLARLNCAPRPVNMEMLTDAIACADPSVSVEELLTQFDRIDELRDDDLEGKINAGLVPYLNVIGVQNIVLDYFFFTKPTERQALREARDKIQHKLIGPLKECRGNAHAIFNGELEIFLKNITLELRKENISLEKKIDALARLAEAAQQSFDRKHAEALKVWQLLTNQVETAEETFLQDLQQAKEDLFRNYYSLSIQPISTLNYIRSIVGDELGLDTNLINLNHPYIHLHDARSPDNRLDNHTTREQFLEVFNHIFTPSNILPIMKGLLNQRISKDSLFCSHLSQCINDEINKMVAQSKGRISEKWTANLPFPFQDEQTYLLTDEGVLFLLVRFGILELPTATIPTTIADNNLNANALRV